MAFNFASSSASFSTISSLRFLVHGSNSGDPMMGSSQFAPKNRPLYRTPKITEKQLSPCRAQSQEVTDESGGLTGSSARSQLDRLEQLTSSSSLNDVPGYESDGGSRRATIREQLSQLVEDGDGEGEFTLPLGKKLKASMKSLTISQRRNIKRQAYLDQVSQRNDTSFFVTIAVFVIIPPFLILVVAILTGYVQLLP